MRFEYSSENAEVEHALLTPYRWLIKIGKFVICAALLIGWFPFTLFGWIVNVGEYSLENRREAICDARAYFQVCDPREFSRTNPHVDYDWVFSRNAMTDEGSVPDVRQLNDGSLAGFGVATYAHEEKHPTAKPWINFDDREFFMRGNDIFRRKSRQFDEPLVAASLADNALIYVISEVKHVDEAKVRLPDAPEVMMRRGVMPANAISSTYYVTWGMCLKQECAADGSDMTYALFWGDILWTRPAIGERQQHAVDGLKKIDTLAFWLQEAHANGVYDDSSIRKDFDENHQIIQQIIQ